MKIMSNLLKDVNDEWLVQTISTLNEANPIVDRILEDESVQGVVMTNKEGNPIFTNINLQHANTYGKAIQQLGLMTKYSVTEIDPFDEVLVVRLQTKKLEVLAVPHKEFNIAVIQNNSSIERNKIILNI
ncbi:uncharacterized protein LOC121726308 isoform X2 [Aricia agestis]|uniref:uncharacterized protein LOC121726308 isoform X2 n=1 Tax=Aricia agestis TaxID=91739 RepID=UPI001C205DC5|nr:uncharacterized protein LOC121726308 isoform X2 [Aricia agestis]